MIGSLRGALAARLSDSSVLVDVGGVGYRVSVTPSTAAGIGSVGDEVFLYVHTHVREDAIVLYGFPEDAERRTFETLLGAHGVGPSLALGIVAVLPPPALAAAVLDDDAEALCRVPGVGRKTAARLLIDLKSRLEVPDLPGSPGAGLGPAHTDRAEAWAALAELGYSPPEIRAALDSVGPAAGVEEMLRLALRELASR